MLTVVWASHAGAVRFNELRRSVGAIPARTLVTRLDELERAGVLERVVVDARPPHVEYRLTERGRRLAPLVQALRAWADA